MPEIVRTYVDRGLALAARHPEYLMYARAVPPPMVAAFEPGSVAAQPARMQLRQPGATTEIRQLLGPADTVWQPVPGTATPADFAQLEQQLGLPLPASYRAYVQYQHHFTLFVSLDIRLYDKPIDQWQQILLTQNEALRPIGLDCGLLAIGDFSDYATLALDLRRPAAEPPVLLLDHETGAATETLAASFLALLAAALQRPEPTLQPLPAWQQRLRG